jgi:hypothetical protein
MNKIVYVHLRADDHLPFYIGVGTRRRAFDFCSRNKFWKNVKNKHGVVVQIIAENLTRAEAFELEKKLISEYRRQYHTMTNICDGGEGATGKKGYLNSNFKHYTVLISGRYALCFVSANQIKEHGFSDKQIYNKNLKTTSSLRYYDDDDVKLRFEVFRTDNLQEVETILDNHILPELKPIKNLQSVNKNHHSFGIKLSTSHKQKLKIASTGKKHTVGAKKKISVAQIGKKNHSFKGYTVGFNDTHFVIAAGAKEITESGFNQGLVSQCVLGKKESHKKFFWYRTMEIDKIKFKNLIPLNGKSMAHLHGFDVCVSRMFTPFE